MTRPLVALRVSRRALATAVVDDETLHFYDGRHLSSQRARAIAAVERYVERVVVALAPTRVIIDAPAKMGSLASDLLVAVHRSLAVHRIPVETISAAAVLASYGVPGLRTRSELRTVVESFWSELGEMRSHSRSFVLEAAAVALYADIRTELGIPPSA